MLDQEQISAAELAAAYHHRWDIETSFAEIEIRQRRSYNPALTQPEMVRQEIWGLLTTHYAIRELMYHATDFDSADPLLLDESNINDLHSDTATVVRFHPIVEYQRC